MTCKEQNKILDRLNAEISAFSSGDLNKYEFLKRIDLNNKPSALDKAKFEFSSLGQTFNIGLDKNAQGYQEEGIIKLLKDIRDGLAGNVIIPARPPRPDNNGNDNNGNDDNGNDNNGNDNNGNDNNGNDDHGNDNNANDNNGNDNNGNDDNGYDNNGNDNNGNDNNGNDDNENDDHGNDNNGNDNNGNDNNGNDDNRNDDNDNNGNDNNGNDLSWMNDLQLYKKIALEVFSRYNEDKNSFELFTLRTFIDNINNERVKNKKDAREEFKNVKKNVKSEALKEIVKDLEQAIFGDDDNDESLIEGLDKDRRFKNLISKKRRESLREHLKESKDANPQGRAKASKKKLNDLFKTISEDNDDSKNNNNNNDNDDSEDNQISNFVDEVLKKVNDDAKKVSKEIVNDDAEKVSKEIVNDDAKKKSNQKSKKNITEEIKEIKEIIELDKKIYGIKS